MKKEASHKTLSAPSGGGETLPSPASFIEEIKTILVEGIFASNWARIECYHAVGKRILDEVYQPEGPDSNVNVFYRDEKKIKKLMSQVTEAIPQMSERTLQRATQFARKYPDLSMFSYKGKSISWSKIVNELLPEPSSNKWSWRLLNVEDMSADFLMPNRQAITEKVRELGKEAERIIGGIEIFRESD